MQHLFGMHFNVHFKIYIRFKDGKIYGLNADSDFPSFQYKTVIDMWHNVVLQECRPKNALLYP